MEWGPSGSNSYFKVYRNGQLYHTHSQSGQWTPGGHSFRLAASNRTASDAGAPLDAVFSNVKIWDMGAAADDADSAADTIPATMNAAQVYSVTLTMKNIGTNAWTQAAGYKLGAVGDSDPFCAFTRVELAPADFIATNQQKTFTFNMTAPGVAGTYTTDWRMVHEGAAWYG